MNALPTRLFPFSRPLAAKVPEVTALFWVIKVLTTGMGEAMSDFLGQKSIPLAAFVGLAGLSAPCGSSSARREYRAPVTGAR